MNIAETIRRIPDIIVGNPADDSQIQAAEQCLGVVFSSEYKEYLREFGTVMFDGHEISGIGPAKHMNVTFLTLNERSLNDAFPSNIYVIENLGDGALICQDESGKIFVRENNASRILCDSLSEYIDEQASYC